MKREITVLIANCGSIAAAPALVWSLRRFPDLKVRIIGVDLNPENPGRYLVDKFYEAPPAKLPSFVTFLEDVCRNEQVDIVLATSVDGVLLSLKRDIDRFTTLGTLIPGTSYDKLVIADDKGQMLRHLDDSNLPCAKFRTPSSLEEFDVGLKELGYPREKVIVKPRTSSGNRGFRILDDECSFTYDDITKKLGTANSISARRYRQAIKTTQAFPEIVMMEYLPGQDYSVYCLADKGNANVVIPVKRLKPGEGVSYISEVDMDLSLIHI